MAMLDYVYTGWGAFWVTMFMFVPFALMAYWVIRRKSLVDTGPTQLQPGEFAPIEGVWLTFAFIFFVVANLASLKYIPWAAASGGTGGEPEVQRPLQRAHLPKRPRIWSIGRWRTRSLSRDSEPVPTRW